MNQAIFNFFYALAHKSVALDSVIVFFARDFFWVVLVVVFFYLLKSKNKRLAIIDIVIVSAAAAIGYALSIMLKDLFLTMRPFAKLSNVHALLIETDPAFPSGHTAVLMTVAGALWHDYRHPAIFVGLCALLVGVARITAGVHWPIDILGGAFLGAAVGVGIYRISRRFLPNS